METKPKAYTGKVIVAIIILFILVKVVIPGIQHAETQYMNNVFNQVYQSLNYLN
jgi:hypothetical protein